MAERLRDPYDLQISQPLPLYGRAVSCPEERFLYETTWDFNAFKHRLDDSIRESTMP
ncbi:hypothetical protein J2129_000038 [Methanofollis sp. W23]|uniref:hypothetical protein n=1 Tax=Methanofollis sp. W23 TaxID=2817849 RepID=UPI001AE373AE|nr:hypothetical protein [Methanofollis sp. W23]MBP2144584.1 hypothetical protein [Methanofollis sp. W23]